MEVDHLAILIQREFESFRGELATREELRSTEIRMSRAIEGLAVQLSQYASQWNSRLEQLADHVHDLTNRMTITRSKLQCTAVAFK
jgi:phage regulator Rha-like protein